MKDLKYTQKDLMKLVELLTGKKRLIFTSNPNDRVMRNLLGGIIGLFLTEEGRVTNTMRTARKELGNLAGIALTPSDFLSPEEVYDTLHKRSHQSMNITVKRAPRICKLRDILYRIPLKEMTLYITDELFSEIAAWRLEITK